MSLSLSKRLQKFLRLEVFKQKVAEKEIKLKQIFNINYYGLYKE